ncbi:MAG: hypothetical protein ABGY10_03690 [bacterium]|nr:MAG: hypothetical protein CXT65_05055 [Euryarchaeota archaeon]
MALPDNFIPDEKFRALKEDLLPLDQARAMASDILVSHSLIIQENDLPKEWWRIALSRKVIKKGEDGEDVTLGAYFMISPINAGRHGMGYMIVKTADFERRVLIMWEAEKGNLPAMFHWKGSVIGSAIDEELREGDPGGSFDGFGGFDE